jgi:Protein of unknown function (DUF2911)
MKRLLCCLTLCCGIFAAATNASAQAMTAMPKAPASPPAAAVATIGSRSIWIAYSSPGVKGRAGKIFTSDGLIKTAGGSQYPIWRTGANSATTLILSGKVKIGSLVVPAGAYTLFADISDPNNWTLIVNKKTGEWGLSHDPAEDLGKTPFTMSAPSSMVENLKWDIKDNGNGTGAITLGWENHTATVMVDAR